MGLLNKRSQDDHVKEDQGYKPEVTREKLRIPGIETLHQQSVTDIAEALSTVLKSRSNILEFNYKVGEYIELVTKNN